MFRLATISPKMHFNTTNFEYLISAIFANYSYHTHCAYGWSEAVGRSYIAGETITYYY